MKGYIKIRKKILSILDTKLSPKLHYHGIHHTLNALKVSKHYIKHGGLTNEEAKLLRLAILLHDIGFTVSSINHEKESILIAEKMMLDFQFNKSHIDLVKGMILSTKIPQTPNTKLEKIICDIDLDYLGSKNYYLISNQLLEEISENSNSINSIEWNKMQLIFLSDHKYHTNFAIKNRQPNKEKRITELLSL